jgi:dimethylhistidine N-methyltransferase
MDAIAQEITSGLMQARPSISPKYFYDARGSSLFEAITRLPEYYLTRTEKELMQTHGAAISHCIGPSTRLIELGAGSCEKGRALSRLINPVEYVAVDISDNFLQASVKNFQAERQFLPVRAVVADISQPFELPQDLARNRRLVFYPGSSIGNFDRTEVAAILLRMRQMVESDGGLLIGFDLPKNQDVLLAAYDDASGVTAAFNLNVLAHVNRLIGSNFVLQDWQHVALFNKVESRIEMHLQARAAASVRWPGGARTFESGARIHTENSYKYTVQEFDALLTKAGFSKTTAWSDAQNWFCVMLAQP